jgi:hypothetical protein
MLHNRHAVLGQQAARATQPAPRLANWRPCYPTGADWAKNKFGLFSVGVRITDSLRNQLAELRRRDQNCKVFGASTHLYRSTPVSAAEVARLESALGVALPPEYRQFLLDIGYGAGPYYGVWGPNGSLAEIQGLAQDYEREEGKLVQPSAPFALTPNDLRTIEAGFAAGEKCPAAERDWPCSGCLPICHQGCTFWSVLVLTGHFVGRVWDVAFFIGYSGEWLPARRPPGWWETGMPPPRELPRLPSPPTFGEWFNGWVERCLSDLPA